MVVQRGLIGLVELGPLAIGLPLFFRCGGGLHN
eukprot:COSAG06_NODE_407_length_16111_cov_3.252748_8_plen_33_part_00